MRGQRAQEVERGAAQAVEETAAVAVEEGEPPRVWAAFGYLGGRRGRCPGAHRGRGCWNAGWRGGSWCGGNGGAVGIAGGAAYGLARGTGWVLENTLFRPQQGSEDAAVQDVRSANGMNDATQPQHFSLRTGSSTSGSPASSRASSQSGFRVQAQSNTPRPFSWGQSQSLRASSSSGQSRRSLPPPSFDQLARDIEAA